MRNLVLLSIAALILAACGPETEAAYQNEISQARGTGHILLTSRQQEKFDLWAGGGEHGMQTPGFFFVKSDTSFSLWTYCDHHYCADSPLVVTKKTCDARVAKIFGDGSECRLYAIEGEIVKASD